MADNHGKGATAEKAPGTAGKTEGNRDRRPLSSIADILQGWGTLLVIPATLIVALVTLSVQQGDNRQQQADSIAQAATQQYQSTLNSYLSEMSTLVLTYKLSKSPSDSVRAIAIAQTDTAIRNLDGPRKGTLVRFLWEAHLIWNPKPLVTLFETNLSDAVFTGANLWLADLSHNKFVGADFDGAILDGDNFRGADLKNAELNGACLIGADLTYAMVGDAHFKGAMYNSKPITMTLSNMSVTLPPTQWPKGFNPAHEGAIDNSCQ